MSIGKEGCGMGEGLHMEGNANYDNSFQSVGVLGLLAKKFETYTIANREIRFYML